MRQRGLKRIIIGAIYITIALTLGWIVHAIFGTKPTCIDTVQNQDEQGIDCGGVCSLQCERAVETNPLEIREKSLLYGGVDRFDALVSVHNPNDEAGAESFRYRMEILNDAGAVVAVREGKSFVLPQETKYLSEINITAPGAKTVSITFSDYRWQRFSGYQEKPSVVVSNKSYEVISSGVGFGRVFGSLRNVSGFDFQSIRVKVVLRDAAGKAIGVNMTQMNTVVSGDVRDFSLLWPTSFPGTVDHVETEVEVDIFHSENLVKQYRPTQEFQSQN